MTLVWSIGVLLVVAAVGWRLARGELHDAVFVVEVRDDDERVHVRGGVPGKDTAAVAAFVRSLELPVGARVWGTRDGGRLRLGFSSRVPESLHQRMRNYFYN